MMCFIHEWNSLHVHRVSEKKAGLFVISSYLCFDSYEFHEHFPKYTVARCEYGINVCDSLTVFLLISL